MNNALQKTSLSLLLLSSLSSLSAPNGYIAITDIGGDIDDALTEHIAFYLNRPPEAIIATHNKPLEKAQIAKIIAIHSGFPNVPVYVGSGCTPQDSRETFVQQNSLWPSFFGYLNPAENERQWNATQAKAYRETFGKEFDDTAQQVLTGSAHRMLIEKSKQCKPEETVDIVALAPLHDIYHALKTIKEEEGSEAEARMAKTLKLWTMGGDYPQGYNWLISPEATDYVLKRVQTICVSSALIRDNGLNVLPQEFAAFAKAAKNTKLAQAIFKDWVNWNKDDQLKNDKNLCDPVTLYLYLHPELIEEIQPMHVEFPCLTENGTLKENMRGTAYCAKGLENQIVNIKSATESNIQFVQKIKNPAHVRAEIVRHIAQTFSPESNL